MKTIARFLGLLLCVAPFGVASAAVVATTAGDNLTAYNGGAGALNNNRWNTMMNSRTGGNTATADFSNCNAVVMRCAQPKCSNGGCTDLSVTSAIVSGCVQSNASCKQYGDELIEYISAQLVANSTAKSNAAQTAAAQAAAQQSAQQMATMQAQMQQMQSEMAAQNAQTVAQLQNALDEQKQLTANAIAEAAAAREVSTQATGAQQSGASGLSDPQISAAQNGVSADVLAREQITGQIMSAIENAEVQLKTLKATMTDVFNYAGCDSRGNNCTGPKRVKMFKQKAEEFFDPYENVLDELYDALILAQSVGVDITDIYMMLNGSCNVWGQYLCSTAERMIEQVKYKQNPDGTYSATTETVMTKGWPTYVVSNCDTKTGKSRGAGVRGGHDCVIGQVIPPEDDPTCTLNKTIVDNKDDPVQRDWLWADQGEMNSNIRVGCASSALESSALFRNRKKQANIDIETLQRIISQDAPQSFNGRTAKSQSDALKYCAISDGGYVELQKAVNLKTLPKTVCVNNLSERSVAYTGGVSKNSDCGDKCQKCRNIIGGEWLPSTQWCSCNGNLEDVDVINTCQKEADTVNGVAKNGEISLGNSFSNIVKATTSGNVTFAKKQQMNAFVNDAKNFKITSTTTK